MFNHVYASCLCGYVPMPAEAREYWFLGLELQVEGWELNSNLLQEHYALNCFRLLKFYPLAILLMYTMYLHYICSEVSPLLPVRPFKVSTSFFMFSSYCVWSTESKQCCQPAWAWSIYQPSHPEKKIAPCPSSQQLLKASQLGASWALLPHQCWNAGWLAGLVQVTIPESR